MHDYSLVLFNHSYTYVYTNAQYWIKFRDIYLIENYAISSISKLCNGFSCLSLSIYLSFFLFFFSFSIFLLLQKESAMLENIQLMRSLILSSSHHRLKESVDIFIEPLLDELYLHCSSTGDYILSVVLCLQIQVFVKASASLS